MKNNRKIEVGQVRMMRCKTWNGELYVIDKKDPDREGCWHLHFIEKCSSHVRDERDIQEDAVVM